MSNQKNPMIVNKGLGTRKKDIALSVRLRCDIMEILNEMPSRADFARAAINEKLVRDGYLEKSN